MEVSEGNRLTFQVNIHQQVLYTCSPEKSMEMAFLGELTGLVIDINISLKGMGSIFQGQEEPKRNGEEGAA